MPKLFDIFPHTRTHKIDIAYLYYLPFCDIFSSSDKIHTILAPIFMRSEQTLIHGSAFKTDFRNLDLYYSEFSEDIKAKGTLAFAPCPPEDTSFITTQLWDRYMAKNWRNHEGYVRGMDGIYKIDPNLERDILKHINEFSEGAKRVDFLVRSDDADDMIIHHTISARRGKWKKLPSDCTDSKQE